MAFNVHNVETVKRRKAKAGHSSSARVTELSRSKASDASNRDATLPLCDEVSTNVELLAAPEPTQVRTTVATVLPVVIARKTLELRAELTPDPFGGGPDSHADLAALTAAVSEGGRSEESLRPMTLDDEFFSISPAPDNAISAAVPRLAAIGANDLTEADRAAQRIARLADKQVVARRESNRRKVTMGLAALALVVGVGGVVRASLRAYAPSAPATAYGVPGAALVRQNVTEARAENPVQIAPTPVAPAPVLPTNAAAADIPSAESVEAPAAVVETAPQLTDKERRDVGGKAKLESQSRLDRGDAKSAIEAGERSVSVDPSDAEAWLILGAAYQQVGDLKNATRAFSACLKDATRGDKSDCAAMLRLGK
jgi:tetratricopeptide (TPR) repeat protein